MPHRGAPEFRANKMIDETLRHVEVRGQPVRLVVEYDGVEAVKRAFRCGDIAPLSEWQGQLPRPREQLRQIIRLYQRDW